jgi:gamma-glutamyltranspeptidase
MDLRMLGTSGGREQTTQVMVTVFSVQAYGLEAKLACLDEQE